MVMLWGVCGSLDVSLWQTLLVPCTHPQHLLFLSFTSQQLPATSTCGCAWGCLWLKAHVWGRPDLQGRWGPENSSQPWWKGQKVNSPASTSRIGQLWGTVCSTQWAPARVSAGGPGGDLLINIPFLGLLAFPTPSLVLLLGSSPKLTSALEFLSQSLLWGNPIQDVSSSVYTEKVAFLFWAGEVGEEVLRKRALLGGESGERKSSTPRLSRGTAAGTVLSGAPHSFVGGATGMTTPRRKGQKVVPFHSFHPWRVWSPGMLVASKNSEAVLRGPGSGCNAQAFDLFLQNVSLQQDGEQATNSRYQIQ